MSQEQTNAEVMEGKKPVTTETEEFDPSTLVEWDDDYDNNSSTDDDLSESWDIELPDDVDPKEPLPDKNQGGVEAPTVAETSSDDKATQVSETTKETEKTEEKVEDRQADDVVLDFKDYVEKLDNIKIRHMIDGELKEIDLKEALKKNINDYVGHTTVDKRFTEFDKEKKAFNQEKQQVVSYIENFAKMTKEGNILGGLGYFAQFANLPEFVIKEQLLAALSNEYERRKGLTADQIQNELLKQENDFLAQLKESETKKLSNEKAKKDLQTSINSLREAHNITEDEWSLAFKEVDKELPSTVKKIPAKAVVEKVLSKRKDTEISLQISEAVKGYEDKVSDEYINEFKKLIKEYPGTLSPEELKQAVIVSFSQNQESSKEDLGKKEVEKELTEKVIKKNKPQVEEEKEDLASYIDWDNE